ncbi:MAG: hypothetical protein K8S94_13025 [Planctomycetia bacterium]|nr:hypothetical protein [Planctomycetia bacterium]
MRPTPANALWLLPILASVVAAAGCRLIGSGAVVESTSMAEAPVATDSRSKPPARTIHLEVLFVRCDEHDESLREELWNFVDERVLGDPTCRVLNANGLRAGIVTGHLPPQLAERFTTNEVAATSTDLAGLDAALARRILQLLPGKRSEIVTASQLRSVVLLEQCDGEVRGGTYHDATAQVALLARPAADGRVRIEAVPELRHGPVEKSWVGEDGMFRLETGQRRHRMEHAGIDVTVPQGGMLVIGCAGDASATVGDVLLREHGRGDRSTMRLLAIRPLGRGADPLFAPADPVGESTAEAGSLTAR